MKRVSKRQDSKFQNIHFSKKSSIVYGCNKIKSMLFSNVVVSNYFVTAGIYFSTESCGYAGTSTDYTDVVFEDCTFEKYNTRLFTVEDDYEKKINHRVKSYGFIVTVHGPAGSFTFNNVVARDMMTCKSRECPAKKDLIVSPDLSDWDTSRVLGMKEFYFNHFYPPTNAAIYFDKINAEVSIVDCTFSRIFGVSGSVITVNGLQQNTVDYDSETGEITKEQKASISIKNTIFEDNFAFWGYPAIRIHQEVELENKFKGTIIQDDIYMNYFRCSSVTLKNVTVSGNYGCPLAPGVVWTACTVPLDLDIVLFSDGETARTTLLKNDKLGKYDEYWDIIKEPTEEEIFFFEEEVKSVSSNDADSKLFVVRESLFENNRMAYSSGIVAYGFTTCEVENNEFTGNGVLFGDLFYQHFKKGFSDWGFVPIFSDYVSSLGFPIFSQTSPLLIAYSAYLLVVDNIFKNNWQLFAGSIDIGSQITLNGFLPLTENSLKFERNQFIENKGIPDNLVKTLPDFADGTRPLTGALITLSVPSSIPPFIDTYSIYIESFKKEHAIENGYSEEEAEAMIKSGEFDEIFPDYESKKLRTTLSECFFTKNEFYFGYDEQTYMADFDVVNNAYLLFNEKESAKTGLFYFFRYADVMEELNEDITMGEYSTLFNNWITIDSSVFSDNVFHSKGCLATSFATNLEVKSCIFHKNTIYDQKTDEWDTESYLNEPYSKPLEDARHGVVCLIKDSSFVDMITYNSVALMLEISESKFSKNAGQLIEAFPSANYYLKISNSQFIGNNAGSTSLITIQEGNNMVRMSNTLFSDNYAEFGMIGTVEMNDLELQENSYKNNEGFWAAVLFLLGKPDMSQEYNSDGEAVKKLKYDYNETSLLDGVSTPKESGSYYKGNKNKIDDRSYLLSLERSPFGGGIVSSIRQTFLCEDCTFTENEPFAGLFMGYDSVTHLANNTIQRNEAYGTVLIGAQFAFSMLIIEDSVIEDNVIRVYAEIGLSSGIYITSGALILRGTNITENDFETSNFIVALEIYTYIENLIINEPYSWFDDAFLNLFSSTVTIFELQVESLTSSFASSVSGFFEMTSSVFSNVIDDQDSSNEYELLMFARDDYVYFDDITLVSTGDPAGSSFFTFLSSLGCLELFISNLNVSVPNITLENPLMSHVVTDKITMENIFISDLELKREIIDLNGIGEVYLRDSQIEKTSSSIMLLRVSMTDSFEMQNTTFEECSNTVLYLEYNSFVSMEDVSIAKTANECPVNTGSEDVTPSIYFYANDKADLSKMTFESVCQAVLIQGGGEYDVKESVFSSGETDYGAGIYVDCTNSDTALEIKESSFIKNYASEDGGAIYLSSLLTNADDCFVMVKRSSTFKENTAGSRGGAAFWDYFPVLFSDEEVVFEDNDAEYGPDVGSYQIGIKRYSPEMEIEPKIFGWMKNNRRLGENEPKEWGMGNSANQTARMTQDASSAGSSSDALSVIPAVSGDVLGQELYYALIDVYGQIVKITDEDSQIKISWDWEADGTLSDEIGELITVNELFRISSNWVTADEGIFDFNDITFSFYPNVVFSFEFLEITAGFWSIFSLNFAGFLDIK